MGADSRSELNSRASHEHCGVQRANIRHIRRRRLTRTSRGGPGHGKRQAVERARLLHPHPDKVLSPLFDRIAFFDPNDKLQVKYEMLRSHEVEAAPINRTAKTLHLCLITGLRARRVFWSRVVPYSSSTKRFVPKRWATSQDKPSRLHGGIDGKVSVCSVCSTTRSFTLRFTSRFVEFTSKELPKARRAGAKPWTFIEACSAKV